MSISKIVSDVKSIVQKMETLRKKVKFHQKKVNEYQKEIDNLQKEYQDLTHNTGLDGILEGRGGTRKNKLQMKYNDIKNKINMGEQ